MTEKKEKLFITPGLHEEIDRFRSLLKASSNDDHILITGPRGVGKSLFLQTLLEQDKNHEYI